MRKGRKEEKSLDLVLTTNCPHLYVMITITKIKSARTMLKAKILCCRLNFLHNINAKMVGRQTAAAKNSGTAVIRVSNMS